MSVVERHRLETFGRVKSGGISLRKAGELCGLSYRQARRVYKRYRERGDAGLVHGGRGRAGNHRTKGALRAKILAAYRERYLGFGAVLAGELLSDEQKLTVSSKTLWRWLKAEGLSTPARRHRTHRSRRERRSCLGEMVQMDGSTHDWFEGRGGAKVCVPYVMIDDATGRVFARFYESEDTRSAFNLFDQYSRRYGLPVSLYVDKDSIYTVNNREWTAGETLSGKGPVSQFGRAMRQLGVGIILAHSPQAKGRVERMNGTLQDRLVKCLRVRGTASITEANVYLEKEFLPRLNHKFMVEARERGDVHRSWPAGLKRAEVLSVVEERAVSRDWCVVYERRVLQLGKRHQTLGLAGRKVSVAASADGRLRVSHQGVALTWSEAAGKPPARPVGRVRDLRPGLVGVPPRASRGSAAATPAAPSAAPPPPRTLRPQKRTVLMR